MSHLRTLGILLVLVGLVSHRAEGQWKFAVTPTFSTYFPTARTQNDVSLGRTEKQLDAPMVGVRATYWLWREVALEAGTSVTKSRIVAETPLAAGGPSVATIRDGVLTFTSVRLLYKPARSNFFGFAGGSMIARRGAAWGANAWPRRDNLGGVVGLGARSEVTSSLSLWVSVEAHIYPADFDGSAGNYYTRTLQNDLLVTIGVPITVLKR